MVDPRSRQRDLRFGSASWQQAPQHIESGCWVRKSKHGFITNPLDWWAMSPESIVYKRFEALKNAYCRGITMNIGQCTEARQIDECDSRERRFEAIPLAHVRIHV